jgi:hypothetical protein
MCWMVGPQALVQLIVAAAFGRRVDEGNYVMVYGKDKIVEKGKYVNVWKKEKGTWKIYTNIWNTNAPTAP